VIRKYGSPIATKRYTLRPGAYAVLELNGELLLTHQRDPIPEFQLPGGGIDHAESPLAALYREVFEETGWRISAPRRIGVFRRFTYMEEYDLWAEKLCHIYLARPTRRHGPPSEPGHLPVWMTPKQAISLLAEGASRDIVRQWSNRLNRARNIPAAPPTHHRENPGRRKTW